MSLNYHAKLYHHFIALACPVGTQQAHDLALSHVETDTLHGLDLAETLVQALQLIV